MPKDWSKIDYDEMIGSDEDEYDTLNVQSVRQNARRTVELLQQILPTPAALLGVPASLPPMGRNRPGPMLHESVRGAASKGAPTSKGAPASGESAAASLPSAELTDSSTS